MARQERGDAVTHEEETRNFLGDPVNDWDDEYECGCQRCGGEGFIIICCDDMCIGAGECIHGDGEIICPDCHGEGLI